ncbi:MAG: ABC transporter substrate-binding protein [Gordonia sp. (in: high G+C Gram-positive bacteria)]
MKHRVLSLAAAAVAAVVVLAGCANSGSDSADASGAALTLTKDVKLVVGTSDLEGAYFTKSGAFDDVPYTIDWSYISDWGSIYSSIASNALNVGYWGLDANIFNAIKNGVPAKIVELLGTNKTDSHTGALDVFVRTNAGITTTKDLKGKTIATGSEGTTFDNVLSAALADGGLTSHDVTIHRYPDSDSTSKINAFLNGDAQVFAGSLQSKPILDALEAGTIKVLYWQDQALPIGRIVVSNAKTLADPRQDAALKDFVARVARTQVWANDPANKQKWIDITTAATHLSADTAAKAYPYLQNSIGPLPFDTTTDTKLTGIIDKFVSFGLLDKSLKSSDVVDSRYSQSIAAAIGGS